MDASKDAVCCPYPRACVAVLLFNKGSVLIGKRKGERRGAGLYAPPGTFVRKGETLTEAAYRALKKETDLTFFHLEYAGFVEDFEQPGDEHHHIVHVFSARLLMPDVPKNNEPEKCEGWEWVTWDLLNYKVCMSSLCKMHIQQVFRLK